MKLRTVIEIMKAAATQLSPVLTDLEVTSFVIDSRQVKAGDVFFALSQPEYANNGFNGDFDDATRFVDGAFAAGAVACVVRTDRVAEHSLEKFSDKLIIVNDVMVAFQELAHGVYMEWNKPVVAITGSAGKTTAKELTAHVLQASGRKILRNIKNYNNGLGHPLTVLNLALEPDFDTAVLEMGMSTPMHEIERLCRITPPDVSVVLNVLPVHVEHLGSIENVAKAKAEIVEGMKPGGVAVLNADDNRVAEMAGLSKGKTLTFGINGQADVMAADITSEGFGKTQFRFITPNGEAMVSFPLNGKHNIYNALAAAAVGHSFGMTADEIANALSTVEPPPQRGEVIEFEEGFTVINDSYNSNPDALLSMVNTLIEGSPNAVRRIVVAGEMLELGGQGAEIHRLTGQKIAAAGIDVLIGVRGLAAEMAEGAIDSGIKEALFIDNAANAGDSLVKMISKGDVVLVKGSRGVKTEQVIDKLLEKFETVKAVDGFGEV